MPQETSKEISVDDKERMISWEEHQAALATAKAEQRKEDDKFYLAAIEQFKAEARAEAFEEAADSFRECGETAVQLAYLDKAKAAREGGT